MTPAAAGVDPALQDIALGYHLALRAITEVDPTSVPQVIPPPVMGLLLLTVVQGLNLIDLSIQPLLPLLDHPGLEGQRINAQAKWPGRLNRSQRDIGGIGQVVSQDSRTESSVQQGIIVIFKLK